MTAFETTAEGPPRTAADWRARLDSGDAGEQDWVQFTAWLEENPDNRLAFDRLDAVLAEVDLHKDRMERPSAKIIRFPAWKKAAAAVALAASILAAFVIARPAAETTWATRTGEHRDVTLADGSVVHLNTATRIAVALDGRQRKVRLESGEALFEVQPDAGRPFTVAAGDQTIEVVGTAFNVLRHDQTVSVTVSHGVVRATAAGAAPARLTAGNQYIRHENQIAYTVTMVDAGAATAWRDGRLAYDNAELSKVVSDLNRNFEKPVVIADPAVGNLRFSGVLKLDEIDDVIRRLEGFLPIAAEPQGNGIVLRARSEK